MLRRRLVTGPLLIAALVGVVALDEWLQRTVGPSGIVFTVLGAGILVPLAGIEAARLLRGAGVRVDSTATLLASEAVLLAALATTIPQDDRIASGLGLLGGFAALLIATAPVLRDQRISGGFSGIVATVGVATWIGLGIAFWVLVARQVGGWNTAGLVLVIKMGDIGAYFTGMTLGRRKMIPWLSPGKTLAGGVGALIWGGAAGALLGLFSGMFSPVAGALAGLVLAGVGAAGDLLESLLKRESGAKDSGSILPGMGGVLDVLDSPLLAGPFAWILVLTLG